MSKGQGGKHQWKSKSKDWCKLEWAGLDSPGGGLGNQLSHPKEKFLTATLNLNPEKPF